MTPNPPLGVLLHAIGGFAAGSFYAPLKKVRRWAWESSWLVMGLAAWLITPWVVASWTTPRLTDVLRTSEPESLAIVFLFGMLWGVGGLTFGLTMRYLGIGLGMAVALGFCAIVGTLEPPIRNGDLLEKVSTPGGGVILAGLLICVAGISICGLAGACKERETRGDRSTDATTEFSLGKGLAIATLSGILSACFAIGLDHGKPIAELSRTLGTPDLYVNNAVLVVILLGGLVTNLTWCLLLNFQNRTFADYVSGSVRSQVANYAWSLLGGSIWYCQFLFYGMGQTKIGRKFEFSSWTLHMAFIIVFSSLWGLYFHEWSGTSRRTKGMVWFGILTLITATIVIGFGNWLGTPAPAAATH